MMNYTVTLSSIIIITRQSFIQSSNAIASIFFLLMLNSFLQFLSTPYAHKISHLFVPAAVLGWRFSSHRLAGWGKWVSTLILAFLALSLLFWVL